MPIYKNFQPVHKQESNINLLQCYPGGTLKYTDLCNLLQLVAGHHAALGGLSFTDLQPLHQAWVLQKMNLDIYELPKWKDCISLETYVIKMEQGKSVRVIEMFMDKKQLVRAVTQWLVMDTQKRKATALGLPFEHFLNHNKSLEIDPQNYRFDTDTNHDKIQTRVVELSDLDILAHVNNVKYLEWCLNFYSCDYLLKHPITKMEIHFIRELREHNQIKILQKEVGNQCLFEITKNDKNSCIVRMEHKKNLPKEV